MKSEFLHRIFVLFFLVTLGIGMLHSQNSYLLTGKVLDAATREPLMNAAILVTPLQIGTISDASGKFELQLPKGQMELQVSFLGYKAVKENINLTKNLSITILLQPNVVEMEGVTISSEKPDQNVTSIQSGTVQLDAKEIAQLPTLMGEPDLINSFRTLPGVQGVGEGNPGLYVRGGDAGQNLMLLDQMPLYNPSHLLGFFPVFSTDIIQNAKLIKGAIPANYGGKTSSVMDISMKEGDFYRFSGNGSVGILSSDLTIETPTQKGKGSLVISGRRTYLEGIKSLSDLIISDSKNFFNQTNYYFYDASLKWVYVLTPKTRLTIATFGGQDKYSLTDGEFEVTNQMDWINWVGSVGIKHTFNENLTANFTSGFSQYQFGIDAGFEAYQFHLFSGVRDYYHRLDFTQKLNHGMLLKYGASFTRHQLTPSKVTGEVEEVSINNINRYYSNEGSIYFQGDAKASENLSLSAGIRPTYYQHVGPYSHYTRDASGLLTDSLTYAENELIEDFFSLDPNLSCVYLLNPQASVKASASLSHQFIHLASVGTVSLPTDIWMPSTQFIKPQKVGLATVGYFRNFLDNQFETSFELYYKYLDNQIDFLNGLLDNFDNTKIEQNIVHGVGQAFGAEIFIKKQYGPLTGWMSYTLSRTLRKFNNINDGYWYPAKYDRVHDFSITMNYQLNDRWNLSALWVYATGNAMTLPAGRYIIQGNVVNDYTDVNSFRMPAYHRLDLSATRQLKKKEHWESDLVLSVYNVYNRANPYFIYFRVKGDIDHYYLSVNPRQISLFPILPALTLNFKFY